MIKNILITGGLGHVGSKLMNELDSSYNVTALDDLSTQRYCSLFKMKECVKFIEKSFDELTVEEVNNYDAIIHLAAKTDASSSMRDSKETVNINIEKTKKLVNTVKQSNVKLFIFPSSTSVYGKSVDYVYEDNNEFINPQSPYAETKIAIENYIKESGVDYVIFRFGTIFGTSIGMRFHTAINKFCYQSSFEKPLTVWKENYKQFRPYLGLNDAIKSIKLVIDNEMSWNETYNVLTENYSLKSIVETINKVKATKINYVNTPLLNQYSYKVNFEKIQNIGFQPKDILESEIENTIKLLNGA